MLVFASIAATAQESADAHLGRGYQALKQERYDEAASEFRAALKIDPTLVMRARFPLAVALFEARQTAEARREFETVRREAGSGPAVAYYLGRLDLQEENFVGAVRNLSEAAARPPFPDTAYHLGFAYLKRGDLPNAEKWLVRAAQTNPDDSAIPYQLAMVYRKQGREVDAKQAFARSAAIRRTEADEALLRHECAQKLEQGPREEAHTLCGHLYDANDTLKLTALGTIYGQHGDLEAALPPLQRAAELEPQSPQMQYNLAYTYFRMGRFQEARGPIAQAVERWPDIFQLNSLYGAVLARLGEDVAAHHTLARAHELNAQDTGTSDLLYAVTMRLARASQASRRYEDALRYFNEAAALRPGDPEPRKALADIAEQQRSNAPH